MKDEALESPLGDYLDENISHGFGSQCLTWLCSVTMVTSNVN